ncbi:MAG TPA: hypothetical protein VG916_04465 [Gemmatimonadaceae bacterium]|nr:hypothetical protein [Gemmatimonadaceae bacterium]
MRDRTRRRANTISRAVHEANDMPELWAVPAIARLLEQLRECDKRIWNGTHAEFAASVHRGKSAGMQKLKDEIRHDHLRLLARLGRKVMGSAPGAERAFHAPGTRARPDVVVTASRAMLKVIGRRQKLFDGMVTPDFFRQLKARTDELDRQWRARDRGRTGWSRAIDDVERATSEGRELLDLLTTYVDAHFRGNRLTVFRWRQAVRVRRKTGRPKRKRRSSPAE